MGAASKLSATADDCVLAAQRSIKKHIGGELSGSESLSGATVEQRFTHEKERSSAEMVGALLKAMVKAACGSDKGTVKLPSGEVTVDATAPPPERRFAEVVSINSFRFDELPADNASVGAVAEATYIRFLRKHSDPTVYSITSFPPCLLQAGGGTARIDVSIGGHILFSLTHASPTTTTLRIFTKCIDTVLGNMCSAAFATSVLPKKWVKELDALSPNNVADLLEDVQLAISEFLGDSAQDEHARTETVFLMASVGFDLRRYFKAKTATAGGVFRGDRNVVEQAMSCCDDWVITCFKLTTIDWGALWGPKKYEDHALLQVRDRLRTVVDLRALIGEISELLGPEAFRSLKTDTLWDAFGDVDVFDVSSVAAEATPSLSQETASPVAGVAASGSGAAAALSTDRQWETGLSTFYRRLEPLEHRCATALSELFGARSDAAPQAVLNEFAKYSQLMKRPVVAKELISERDGFLTKLNERLQAIRIEFEHRAESVEDETILEEEDRRCQTGRFMPAVANNIIWLRQLRGSVEEMIAICTSTLSDLRNASDFVKVAKELLEEIEDYTQQTYRNWVADVEEDARSLMLDANAPLMEIDEDGKVEVNYSERLVQLLKEVRIFNSLGYRVPDAIIRISKQGHQFYQKAVALKQVANTYNSMSDDIIPSTQAMLLEPAVKFEKVITADGNSHLTWKSEREADAFIRKLRGVSQTLNDNNRLIHKLHREIESIVLELFHIDMLRARERWVGKVRAIREKMEVSPFRNMESWKQFWDMQLYKAMEAQYQRGLESLHETVEEIKADVVYDPESGQAGLRPSLEIIRAQYYQRIRDFITFPIRFIGCSGDSGFFKDMPGRNEQGIHAVMQHASQLFRQLEKQLRRFTPLLVIGRCGKAGNPTLEEIVGKSLTEVQHWEQSIRLLKQKGKEINSEDLFVKVGCLTLCTAGIKGTVEEHLSKLNEVLRSTLKRSAEGHLNSIDNYLIKASECLDSKLTKLDEIGQANLLYGQLMEKRPAMEVEFHHFYNKNILLQSMTGSAGLDFTKTKDQWDFFMRRLDSHEKEVDEQMNKLKATVDGSVRSWTKDLERFTNQWNEGKPKDMSAKNPVEFVTKKREELAKLKDAGAEFVKQCQFFQLDEPDTQPLEDLAADIENYYNMWNMLGDFDGELQDLRKESWISFRAKIYRFEDFVKQWQERLKEIQANAVTVHIRTTLDGWERCTPLFKFARGDGFTPSHWTELFNLLGLRGVTQDTVTFGQILDKYETLLKNEAAIKKLHSRAQGEAQIREALDDVRAWGTEARFFLSPHPDRAGVMLIVDWKDTLSALSDNQSLLLSMKDSPFFSVFASDAAKWEERLGTLDEYLRYMNQIQRKWVYLEPIFRRGALPNEQPRFERLDGQYLQVMKTVQEDSRLITLAGHTEYKQILRDVLEQLDRCQKALNQFLEEKRDSFPRFYFISDDDLLEILAQSKNPAVIQSHLKKLFMGIHSVQFDSQKESILRVYSLDGEAVPLSKPVRVTDIVEGWLAELDREMKSTLQQHLVSCVHKSDIGAFASQILCTAEMINFTRKTEEALRDSKTGGLKKHKATLQAQLRELTAFAGSNTDALIGIKLKALIMNLIHNIEVVDLLLTHNVEKDTDWLWRKQLRFYLEEGTNLCVLRMVDAQFSYSYEYQGNAPKLVHTPLTDRCYLTLTQGMQLGYGGNPYGPAGTGKTESVKALGNAMGRQVLVFNCDEGIDFKSMGRIFTGLVKCGAWGCFDEFNRLKVDQLSAVSQMIQVIQEALKNGDRHCHLLGRDVDVNANAGIFVTMNPAGKGYGGRSKLPDNLKALFRSIAMSAPDNELIIETILFSEGFENAKELAKKTLEIFNLSRQLLSYQQHYDWGLRAMKAVLRLGGTLIHSFLMDRVAGKVSASEAEVLQRESEILIKSLRVNTLSKLTFDDAILFNNLVGDIFPGVPVLEVDYAELRPAVEASVKELKLQLVEPQVQKILQLYEALRQRMGVVLVGPSGSGKSTLLRVLRKALQRLGTTVPLYAVNPKALARDKLLGRMDPDTREWYDGVITEAAKKVVKEASDVRSWIFCDGDIDPEWVESLNSVLDDNKLLTMPNGVRIQFGDNVSFVFETHSLEHASPATVSRMGIIYLSEEDVDPKIAVASWLEEQPEDVRTQLRKWIEEYFYKAIDSLLATDQLVVETTRTGLVMSGLSQLQGCTSKAQFALALIYGLGSYLPEDARKDYAKDVLYLVGEKAPDPKAPLDFRYDTNRAGYVGFTFEPSLDLTVDELFRHPMIPTVDCQRALEVMKAWLRPVRPGTYRPFILVGPEGCGKSMLLNNLFANCAGTRVATVNCSAQTEAVHVIQKLRQTCQMFNSNQGKVLRPKEAERLVLLLKDLNLPKPDKYGTVQLHSLLQQLVVYNGFYDSDLEWVTVERLQIVGSMNPPGSMGRYPVSPRFLAITSVLSISYPSKESLQLIYSEFFNVMMQSQRLKLNIPGKGAADIARIMTTVYESIRVRYTVDVVSHYVFNPRNITKWALNLLNYASHEIGDAVAYEGRRIFVDRLVTYEERVKLSKVIKENVTFLVGHKDAPSDKESVYYVSWLDGAPLGKRKLLSTNLDDLRKSAEQFLLSYSREHSDLSIQLIPEVNAWIARVDRVLSQERGNLLLVARAGVCAMEIVRLVAFNNRTDVVTLGITRDYGVKQFNAELKAVMTKAGVEGQSTVLLLEDANFFNSSFLETVNSLLSSGEVPGIFTPEEQDAMLGPLKEDAAGEGMSAYAYFVDRIARFLHVVVVMDPTSTTYEPQCRANPALFTRCNLYWMGTWGSGSLKVIPRMLIPEVYKAVEEKDKKAGGEGKKDFSLATELVHLHRGFGDKFSPQQFKMLCQTYEGIFRRKSDQVAQGLQRLKQGVEKLDEAQANVDKIASDVGDKKTLLEVKQKEADEALKEIQARMEEAGEQKRGIHKVQKELAKEQAAIQERKTVIEDRLSGIQPVLDAALSAVSSIRSDHLAELKSMKQPPAAVQDVLEGVIVLIQAGSSSSSSSTGGAADLTWAGIRKILAGDIKTQILNFDIDHVSEAARAQVEKFIATKPNSFKREVIGRASKAAAPMAEWLKAVIEYSKVLETVAPMRAELKEYEQNLTKGQSKKAKYESRLVKVEEKVEQLKRKFGDKTTEAERLRGQLEHAEQLLTNATELLGKLSGEHNRWTAQMKSIASDEALLPRRCVLAAGFITYLGQEAEDVRRRTVAEWKETLKLPDFTFFTFLREESTQLRYKAQGLPSDELSMDNAVIIQEQVSTPLIEDPSGQAVMWLTSFLKARKDVVEVCSMSDERLVSALELALRFGKKFIVTDVDRIEPFLYPILRRELHNEGGAKKVIRIGDRRTVDYTDGFQLYLVTPLTEMRVASDIVSFLTGVSFSITQSGLEGQFLGITIQHEQPELEQEKLSILGKEEKLKLQLSELEEELLSDLASSKGSLLENSSLIDSLNQIKSQAAEIGEALDKSREVQEQLDVKRNAYRPFATTASHVFFLTKGLKELSHMYQFSFGLFMDLFHQTLAAHKDLRTDPETKIVALEETFIQRTVASISRALLKEHRVVFGIHLAKALHPKQCTDAEWAFFLDKAIAPEKARAEVRVPTFVLPDSVETFRTFAVLFPDLVGKIRFQEADVWLQWMRTSTPEQEYPALLKPLTHFQRLLVMKTLRGDRLIAAMNIVACELLKVSSLGESNALSSLVASSESGTPVLVITTSGADPSQELQSIAHKKIGREHFFQLAMGGGQTDEALRLLRSCAESGDWLFLKNLHLVIPWVTTLQKELSILKPHTNFRLFLTSEAHDEFPAILLSQCLKVTFESPPGVKQNLLRTFSEWGKSHFEAMDDRQRELLFLAAALHAVVQERRSYVPQGWSKLYELTASDLKSSSDIVLRQSRKDGGGSSSAAASVPIDWRSIRGLLESAIYGGKMETAFDTRILETYIAKFFDPTSLPSAKRQASIVAAVKVPSGGSSFSDFVKLIKTLPDNDVPALFTLPPNADRVVQISAVRQFIVNLQRINEAREEANMTREEWAARLTPILDSWAQLTGPHADLLTKNAAAQGLHLATAKPVEGFIASEMAAALRLVSLVDACVSDLRKVVEGAALLTENRRAEAAAMLLGDVPSHWDGHFAGSTRILAWMQALIKKAVAISQWQTTALNGNLLKSPLDLSLLFRPQTFLNALRQETAHVTKKPLVSLQLHATTSAPPKDAAVVVELHGMLLQGAILDDADLLQPIATADEPAAFPIKKMFLTWTSEPPERTTAVPVPLYANSTKESFLADFVLPCASDVAAKEFILAGVSLVLEQ